jgi:hypothetical protein
MTPDADSPVSQPDAAAPAPDATRYDNPPPADAGATRYGEPPAGPYSTNYSPPAADPGVTPIAAGDGVAGRERLPRRFGRYKLLRVVNRGGMGVIYEARDPRIDHVVALKVLRAGADYLSEVRAAMALRHEHILPVHEYDEVDGQPYFTMPLMAGSLQDLLRDGPLPAEAAARLVEQVARAVQHAHEKRVLHRDIKPANVLLQRGVAGRSGQGPAGDAA